MRLLLQPINLLLSFITDLLNNNPKVLLMKFLGLFFAFLSWYIAYRYKFDDWYSVCGFAVSGVLSFLFACFSYMEDKEITLSKINQIIGGGLNIYKKIKESGEKNTENNQIDK